MKKKFRQRTMAALAMLVLSAALAEAQLPGANQKALALRPAPAAGSAPLPVAGGGTLGRLTKWTGFTSSNAIIGDTTIFEDKYGKVGIGTDTPTSRLTVQGMIETTLGGLKFPDGTVQTTAGLSPSQVVRSLNGLMGDLQLAAGANINITPSGNLLTIAAPNLLSAIAHDGTLAGNGTQASPLGVAVPLNLTGAVPSSGSGEAVIKATNTAAGTGVSAFGGSTPGGGVGGTGVVATGGDTGTLVGGVGVLATGGRALGPLGKGGTGVMAVGGVGLNGANDGLAGDFFGDVEVTGNLSKGGGSFKIDHPLDPENKYLYHSFVESPDMMNIYNGNLITDGGGQAVVNLPDYFEALNKDFRYQLTVIGTFAQAIVAEEIKGNRFTIKTNAPNVKVSWQVTGIRRDAYADAHRVKVEEDKPERERGYYLHPDVFGQPEERGVESVHHPEMMQRLKERREQANSQRHQH